MKFYLIRHGRQMSPLCNVDVPLAPEGRRQAELLGKRLEAERPDAVWSSGLLRAVGDGGNRKYNLEPSPCDPAGSRRFPSETWRA